MDKTVNRLGQTLSNCVLCEVFTLCLKEFVYVCLCVVKSYLLTADRE